MAGIIGVSGASSFNDVILCERCLLQDVDACVACVASMSCTVAALVVCITLIL